jgi:cytochrome c
MVAQSVGGQVRAALWTTLAAALMGAMLVATAAAQPDLSAPADDARAADEEAGATIYENVCSECHGGLIAPSLRGIAGRPIASIAGYEYSAGLKAKRDQVWTDASLDAFIKDPPAFAPGTDMDEALAKDQDRADVIAFLKTLPPPRQP